MVLPSAARAQALLQRTSWDQRDVDAFHAILQDLEDEMDAAAQAAGTWEVFLHPQ
jgi:hypothetical protein